MYFFLFWYLGEVKIYKNWVFMLLLLIKVFCFGYKVVVEVDKYC